jgi:catechol 2,3-dioxygenase-like lactoylglutathione lyase family enzyme
MITGINHTTLSVRNLETSFTFYTAVLGLRPLARWYKGAYLQAGEDWICLTLDSHCRATSLPEYTHMAFTVSAAELPVLKQKIQLHDANFWQENHSYGDSFYFLDPDGHKLEIHASSLTERLRAMQANPPKDFYLFNQEIED